jgi:hypothetical protein
MLSSPDTILVLHLSQKPTNFRVRFKDGYDFFGSNYLYPHTGIKDVSVQHLRLLIDRTK